jgi:hypothetical protein
MGRRLKGKVENKGGKDLVMRLEEKPTSHLPFTTSLILLATNLKKEKSHPLLMLRTALNLLYSYIRELIEL